MISSNTRLDYNSVLNFGVSSYGADQSFIKLQNNIKKHPTPFVLLVYIADDFERSFSTWSYINNNDASKFTFKPRINFRKHTPEIIRNPLDKLESRNDILAAFEKGKESDLFYQYHWSLLANFPYLVNLLNWFKRLKSFSFIPAEIVKNEFESLLIYMANETEKLFAKYNLKIIHVFLPTPREFRAGKLFYSDLLSEAMEQNPYMDVIDVGKTMIQNLSASDLDLLFHGFNGQPTEQGNVLLADIIFDTLEREYNLEPENCDGSREYEQ